MLMLTPAHVRAPAGVSRPVRVGTAEAAAACRARHHHLLICFTSLPTITLLFPLLSFCRCERAGPMRLFPSMPLACHHTIPTSSAGWILALALLFALQVKFSSNCLISCNGFYLFQIYFLAAILIDSGKRSICKSVFSWGCFSLQAFIPVNIN